MRAGDFYSTLVDFVGTFTGNCGLNCMAELNKSILPPRQVGFATWLGLKPEGIMRKYGPDGSDYYRMAKIY